MLSTKTVMFLMLELSIISKHKNVTLNHNFKLKSKNKNWLVWAVNLKQ